MDLSERLKRGSKLIPPYIYGDASQEPELCQGDIVKVTGRLRLLFKRYYPSLKQSCSETNYAMILTQSCDLIPRVRIKDRNVVPSALHITLCPIRPVERTLLFEMEQLGKPRLAGKVSRLINNSESKHLFFLPKNGKLPQHSVAILSLGYSFRRDIYQNLLENRVLSLKPEFQAKVGMLLAEYYGRVATDDLFEEYGDEGLLRLSANVLTSADIKNAHSEKAINHLKKKGPKTPSEMEDTLKTFLVQERLTEINALKKKVSKFYSDKFFAYLKSSSLTSDLALGDRALRGKLSTLSQGLEDILI